jgi:hypothetical protein
MLTLRIPRTKVQQNGSMYVNTHFHVKIKTDHHVIAWTPLIDNERVLHHITVFGCDKIGEIFLNISQLCTKWACWIIYFASFYDFSNLLWNCSDNVVFLVFWNCSDNVIFLVFHVTLSIFNRIIRLLLSLFPTLVACLKAVMCIIINCILL